MLPSVATLLPAPVLQLWVFNVLQAIRLLATRGHYSIDLLVGWVVATYLTNSAQKLGNWYSFASVEEVQDTVIKTLSSVRDPVVLFERVLRLRDIEVLSLDEESEKDRKEREQDPQAPARVAAALAARKASEVASFAREKAEE